MRNQKLNRLYYIKQTISEVQLDWTQGKYKNKYTEGFTNAIWDIKEYVDHRRNVREDGGKKKWKEKLGYKEIKY